MSSTLLESALPYARRGWRVFPCGRNKEPLIPRGFYAATTDENQISEWWTRWPHAAIGILCDGIAVLDVDVKHDGPATLARLEAEYGKLPETYTVRTGSGGLHYYYSDV